MEFVELSTGNKLFLLLLLIQIWVSTITLAGLIYNATVRELTPDILAFTLFMIVFSGSVIAFFGIFNDRPPLHLFVYPAAISNIILAVFDSQGIQTVNLVISVLILYFQIRDPILVLGKEYRRPSKKKVQPRKR